MNVSEYSGASASELRRRIAQGDVSPIEAVDAALARIDEVEPCINAVIARLDSRARSRAREAQHAIDDNRQLGPLHGVPVVVKDLYDFVENVPNTFGCVDTREYVPEINSLAVRRLEQAGAILVAKTNTPAFGHKAATDNRLKGPTSTPFALDRNAGGSSGGTAACVAAGVTPVGLGSDAAGSIRVPASFCSIVGLKATRGRVPSGRRPNAFGSQTLFTETGPLARTVDDVALMLKSLQGPAPEDPLCMLADEHVLPTTESARSVPRVVYSNDLGSFPLENGVFEKFHEVLHLLGDRVHLRQNDVPLPDHQDMCDVAVSRLALSVADAVDILRESGYLSDDYDLPHDVSALLRIADRLSAMDLRRQDRLRTRIYDAVEEMLQGHDALISPTVAVTPFRNLSVGQTKGPDSIAGDPVNPLIGWCLTYPFNLTGHPALSVPGGLTDEGLPVGIQIVSRKGCEGVLFAIARHIQQVVHWGTLYDEMEL